MMMFQSLFFWNSRPDGESSNPIWQSILVSILVFLELAPGQVLGTLIFAAKQGFNPCFSGTRART